MKKITNLIIIVLLPIISVAQTYCDCCPSFNNYEEFEKYFPSELINKYDINSVKISYEFKSEIEKNLSSKPLTTILFNDNGFVITKQDYHNGISNIKWTYVRDDENRIIRQEMTYVDSNGVILSYYNPSITDISYDGNTIKIKSRDYQGNILPDNIANYNLKTYDNDGRLKNLFWQIHFENDSIYHVENRTVYEYKDTNLLRIGKSYREGKLSLTDSVNYNVSWQILSIFTYDYRNDKRELLGITQNTYDSKNKLLSTKSENIGFGTECSDGGNFEILFFYKKIFKKKLIKKMIYKYADKEIVLTLEYD